jgi:hypothetical protein
VLPLVGVGDRLVHLGTLRITHPKRHASWEPSEGPILCELSAHEHFPDAPFALAVPDDVPHQLGHAGVSLSAADEFVEQATSDCPALVLRFNGKKHLPRLGGLAIHSDPLEAAPPRSPDRVLVVISHQPEVPAGLHLPEHDPPQLEHDHKAAADDGRSVWPAPLTPGRHSARRTEKRRRAPDTPFSSTGPTSLKVTDVPSAPSTTSRVTSTSPGLAYSAILAAMFTVRPK